MLDESLIVHLERLVESFLPCDTHFDARNASWSNPIDYSEVVTEPDCVLSMRDIYNRYVVTGDINGISGTSRPLIYSDVPDEFADNDEFEEPLDLLRVSQEVKQGRRSFVPHNDDEPDYEPEKKPAQEPAGASETEIAPGTKASE